MVKFWQYYLKQKFLIFLIFALGSCSNNSQKVNIEKSKDFYDKVMNSHYRQGSDIEQNLLNSAIIYNPRNADAYYEKSAWQIKIGNYAKYFEYIDKAVELNPKIYMGWRGVIKLHYLRDYEGAIEDLISYKELFPETHGIAARGEDVDYLIGLSYMGLYQFHIALDYFNKSISNAKEENLLEYIDPYIFVYKAICHIKLNDLHKSNLELDRALKYYPKCSEAYYYKAVVAEINGNPEACSYIKKSKVFFEKGYYLQDTYREVHFQLYKVNITKYIEKNCSKNLTATFSDARNY